MTKKQPFNRKILATWLIGMMFSLSALPSYALEEADATEEPTKYSASFKGTDIHEFISTIGKNLNRTIIIDPSVRGKVDVRSYTLLDDAGYYQVFLNVLELHGYAVIEMPNNVLKVVKNKKAKASPIRVADDDDPGMGDEVVTRIVPVHNVNVRQLSSTLRQLSNNSGNGHIAPYEPSRVLIITGSAVSVERLVEIVRKVDRQGDLDMQVVKLKNASSKDLVTIIDAINKAQSARTRTKNAIKVVADERTNSLVVTASKKDRKRMIRLIHRLDGELAQQGNTQVRYIQYGTAKDLVDVLNGYIKTAKSKKSASKKPVGSSSVEVSVVAHEQTNAVVISGDPAEVKRINSIIDQLDIHRAQVSIEAIIVRVEDDDGEDLGLEITAIPDEGKPYIGGIKTISGNKGPTLSQAATAIMFRQDGTDVSTENQAKAVTGFLSAVTGVGQAVMMGNWAALFKAVNTSSRSNVLSTPNVVTLDNQEAEFFSGQEVSVASGTSKGDKVDDPYTSYSRQKIGTTLKVTPRINAGGSSVTLVIEQKSESISAGADGDKPTVSESSVTTTVEATSGQIVVIGGIIEERMTSSETKVPLLGDIPILGELFRGTAESLKKTNLMIFIKPTILHDNVTVRTVSGQKYNYMRALQLLKEDDKARPWSDPMSSLQDWDRQSTLTKESQQVLNQFPQTLPLDRAPALYYLMPELYKQSAKANDSSEAPEVVAPEVVVPEVVAPEVVAPEAVAPEDFKQVPEAFQPLPAELETQGGSNE